MSNLQTWNDETFDGVLVAGGGVAGCAAAIGAARAGAPVLVLESGISLGGMATSGLLPLWMNGSDSPLRRELDRRAQNCPAGPLRRDSGLDHESMKLALEEWFEELGIAFRYHTAVVDAVVNGRRFGGLFAAAPEGLVRFSAPLLIDATGDGALAAAGGVAFALGRPGDRLCQGGSLAFELGGIVVGHADLPESFDIACPGSRGDVAALARQHLTPPAGHLILHRTSVPGVVSANMTNAVGFDFTNAAERTGAIRLCRRQILEIIRFLREYMPGFENCYLRESAAQFGVRESRHFLGRHTLSEQDILSGKIFSDWVAAHNHFPFDLHSVEGCGLDRNGMLHGFPADVRYTIPLGSCLPRDYTGLLLAGRNISGTHIAHSSFRVMPICLNIGLGVGVAAALAWKQRRLPEEVDIVQIQQELIRQGVVSPEGGKAR